MEQCFQTKVERSWDQNQGSTLKIGERCWHCLRKAIQRHKKARLEFAQTHKDWTAERRSQVIFSDESRFLLHRNDGRVYVRRMAGEEFMEDCVQPTMEHRGGVIMVCGCINTKGVEFLTKVDRREGWMGKVTSIFWKMYLSQPLTCWQSPVAGYFSRITPHVTPPG